MSLFFKYNLSVLLLLFLLCSVSVGQSFEPVKPRLETKWTSQVTPENVHQEYPRPMMVRDQWKNLNGLWDFKITGKWSSGGDEYERQILVPFPVESDLSGISETVGAHRRVWYKRNFTVDNPYENGRVLLHFGAVDWETDVFINDQHVGMHQGGYDPFTFDITDYLTEGEQEIEVTAWDPTDLGKQPVGKQTHDPRSIWYTANTGIWQTVWLEYVPASYIEDIKITPQVDESRVKIEVMAVNAGDDYQVRAEASANEQDAGESAGYHKQHIFIQLEDPELWSPDNPFLYDLHIALLDSGGNVVDEVSSYFGMREIDLALADDGFMRLFLNDEELFHLGPLDQGWWPDGLYTAPTDEALKYDIQVTKDLGFNMLRKHVKIEPRRFYYWCDKMGVLVWQDMPSGDMRPSRIPDRSPESAQQFMDEYKAMIDALFNHPSIVMWVPFNEGWGQFRTQEITKWTQDYDPTRLVNNASGWTDTKVGDVHDVHRYPGPGMPQTEDNRAAVLGEFGGQALVVKDHLWIQDFSRAPGHYKTSTSKKKLHDQYDQLIKALYPLKDKGLAAAVYTQTTDVESEVNGFMTYDRKVIKFDEKHLQEIHGKFYE